MIWRKRQKRKNNGEPSGVLKGRKEALFCQLKTEKKKVVDNYKRDFF